jgi:hypothetical protein
MKTDKSEITEEAPQITDDELDSVPSEDEPELLWWIDFHTRYTSAFLR